MKTPAVNDYIKPRNLVVTCSLKVVQRPDMNFDQNKLVESLSGLTPQNRLLFAASCCERLIPNYSAFFVMERWGDPKALMEALNEIWSYSERGSFSKEHVQVLLKRCRSLAPESEDFASLFVSAAQNAAAAIVYALEYCLDGDMQHVAVIARLAIESIEDYLYRICDPDLGIHSPNAILDEWVQNSPLLAVEIQKQKQDLETLKSHTRFETEFIKGFRKSSANLGIQPFLRGIVKEVPSVSSR